MNKRKTSSRTRRPKKSRPWTKFKEIELTRELLDKCPSSPKPDKFYKNSRYVVFWFTTTIGKHTLIRLTIRNKDHSAKHDWREFQRIKNELLGRDEEAVELYPVESRLIDTKNEFHLWCLRGAQFRFGWDGREISEASGMQRPWPEGEKPVDLRSG
jgi:hypothetical protein